MPTPSHAHLSTHFYLRRAAAVPDLPLFLPTTPAACTSIQNQRMYLPLVHVDWFPHYIGLSSSNFGSMCWVQLGPLGAMNDSQASTTVKQAIGSKPQHSQATWERRLRKEAVQGSCAGRPRQQTAVPGQSHSLMVCQGPTCHKVCQAHKAC